MKKKQKFKLTTWQNLWKLLKKSKKDIIILFFLIIAVEIASLLGPYILKLIIDKISNFQVDELKPALLLLLFYFLAEITAGLIHIIEHRQIFKLIFSVESDLYVVSQKKLVYLPLAYHEKENTGNKISKIERGVQKIIDLVGNLSWEVVPTLIQLFLTFLVLLAVDWRFGLTVAFFAPGFIFITLKSNRVLYPLRKARYKNYEKASGLMAQTIININTVKSFVQEKREAREYFNLRNKIKINAIKEWFSLTKFWLGRDFMIDTGRAAILFLSIYFVYQDMVSIGTLVFVLTLSEKSFFSLYRLSRFYDRLEDGAVAIERLNEMLELESEIINKEHGIKPNDIIGKIKFTNVSYAYNDSRQEALSHVDVDINSGCTTALVGPSGGGKTTLVRLIYRHYDPQEGAIELDGKNLKDYDIYGFRRFISIVPQEVDIFSDTARNNIAYAKPNASEQEIEAAAKIANADEFIQKLSKKYDTEVGERGIKLSGGQRQRIGIARAILANPRILIFDEATSNLDSYSEKLIQEAMDKISKGRTVIIIAHRLSTIRKADKIIVLEGGKVVEQGNHYELARKQSGLYAKLLNLQKMGDVE